MSVVYDPQGSALWCHFRSSFLSKGGVQLHAVHAVHAVLFAITRIYWLSTVGEYLKGTEFVKQLKRYLQGLWFTKFKDPTRTCRLWRYLGKWLKVPYSLWSAKCGTKKIVAPFLRLVGLIATFLMRFPPNAMTPARFPFAKCVHKKRLVRKGKATQKATCGTPGMQVAKLQEAKTQECDKCSWGTSWERCFCILYWIYCQQAFNSLQ